MLAALHISGAKAASGEFLDTAGYLKKSQHAEVQHELKLNQSSYFLKFVSVDSLDQAKHQEYADQMLTEMQASSIPKQKYLVFVVYQKQRKFVFSMDETILFDRERVTSILQEWFVPSARRDDFASAFIGFAAYLRGTAMMLEGMPSTYGVVGKTWEGDYNCRGDGRSDVYAISVVVEAEIEGAGYPAKVTIRPKSKHLKSVPATYDAILELNETTGDAKFIAGESNNTLGDFEPLSLSGWFTPELGDFTGAIENAPKCYTFSMFTKTRVAVTGFTGEDLVAIPREAKKDALPARDIVASNTEKACMKRAPQSAAKYCKCVSDWVKTGEDRLGRLGLLMFNVIVAVPASPIHLAQDELAIQNQYGRDTKEAGFQAASAMRRMAPVCGPLLP